MSVDESLFDFIEEVKRSARNETLREVRDALRDEFDGREDSPDVTGDVLEWFEKGERFEVEDE